jgi:hypothetical protein
MHSTAVHHPKSLDEYRAPTSVEGRYRHDTWHHWRTLLALTTAAKTGEVNPATGTGSTKYVSTAGNDLRCAEVITTPKVIARSAQQTIRSRFYVHVVDPNADGIFITGAKMHISASSIEHELVIMPTSDVSGRRRLCNLMLVPVNARPACRSSA